MLIDFSIQNFMSFNTRQELSMVASSSTTEDYNDENTCSINKFGITNLLKSAAVFGANASGKSNLVRSLKTLKDIILNSLDSVGENKLKTAIPFLLKKDIFDQPTEYEISFITDNTLYRYGLSILNSEIEEEWLYWTKSARETMLFHRNKQHVKFNQRSFSEAKDFVRKKDDSYEIEKTRTNVPFITVLSQFNGEKSTNIINWFLKLNIISGLNDNGFKEFTIKLFESNSKFKQWALNILSSLQIQDVMVKETDVEFPLTQKISDLSDELQVAANKLHDFYEKNKSILKEKRLEVIKNNPISEESYSLPLSLESEGTRKLIYLLGPIFDIINNKEILIIDEFDNKFHTLLCKFLISLYHKFSESGSQIIMTCHDTNLLTKELFRRDQIWFIEKNSTHESQLYGLLEYKEYYTRKSDSYNKDYLAGKYGAIPLFNSLDEIGAILND